MSHTTSNDFLLTCGIFFTENKTKKIVEPHYCHLNSVSAIVNFCRAKKYYAIFSNQNANLDLKTWALRETGLAEI